jgi:hypothetical protein
MKAGQRAPADNVERSSIGGQESDVVSGLDRTARSGHPLWGQFSFAEQSG